MLFVTLVGSTLVKPSSLSALGAVVGGAVGACVLLLPLVFASSIFSLLFKYTKDSTTSLSFNLLGGLFGVCLEYLSMWLGIAALGYIALAIYAFTLSLYLLSRSRLSGIESSSGMGALDAGNSGDAA
jgi:hypothetical protein